MDPADLVDRARRGERRALARIISIVEEDREGAAETLASLFPDTGRAHIVGVTGAPGAGKSTLVDRVVAGIRTAGDEVAVVAVDPSSPFTGGAILGDRIRMQDHVEDAGVYVRSLASRGHLGGMSVAAPRVVSVLDAIGFPWVIVETVGVGQAEVEIAGEADTTIVVVNPGWGDSIQASKAGLLEIADVFVVNKADRPGAADTVRDLRQMLELGGRHSWEPPIVETTATAGEGVSELLAAIRAHRDHLHEGDRIVDERRARLDRTLRAALRREIEVRIAADGDRYRSALADVIARRRDPWSTAADLAHQPVD